MKRVVFSLLFFIILSCFITIASAQSSYDYKQNQDIKVLSESIKSLSESVKSWAERDLASEGEQDEVIKNLVESIKSLDEGLNFLAKRSREYYEEHIKKDLTHDELIKELTKLSQDQGIAEKTMKRKITELAIITFLLFFTIVGVLAFLVWRLRHVL